MASLELLGFVAGGIGTVNGLPQFRQVRALGHGAGVSLATWLLMYTAFCAWTGYGVLIGSPSIVISNVITAVVGGSVVVALRDRPAITTLGLGALAVAIVGLVQVVPAAVTSAVLVALTLARLPQIKTSYLTMRSRTPSAVSFSSLWITVASLVLWGVYAIISGRVIVQVTCSIALSTTLLILALEHLARRPVQAEASSESLVS